MNDLLGLLSCFGIVLFVFLVVLVFISRLPEILFFGGLLLVAFYFYGKTGSPDK